jgi:hypothetical protein
MAERLTEDQVREIEDRAGNHIVVLAGLWDRRVRRGLPVDREHVSELYPHARELLRVLRRYRGRSS